MSPVFFHFAYYLNKKFLFKLNLKCSNGIKRLGLELTGIQLGTRISRTQLHKVSYFVNDAILGGTKVILGGKPATYLRKLFYEPTVLADVKEDMIVYYEDIFGPVINLIRFNTEKEALANGCDVGLPRYFFSENICVVFRVSKNIEIGMMDVNEGLISCAEAPFGGIKQSRLGREGSYFGSEDYTM